MAAGLNKLQDQVPPSSAVHQEHSGGNKGGMQGSELASGRTLVLLGLDPGVQAQSLAPVLDQLPVLDTTLHRSAKRRDGRPSSQYLKVEFREKKQADVALHVIRARLFELQIPGTSRCRVKFWVTRKARIAKGLQASNSFVGANALAAAANNMKRWQTWMNKMMREFPGAPPLPGGGAGGGSGPEYHFHKAPAFNMSL